MQQYQAHQFEDGSMTLIKTEVQRLFIVPFLLRLFQQVQVFLIQQPQADAGLCRVSFDALRYPGE